MEMALENRAGWRKNGKKNCPNKTTIQQGFYKCIFHFQQIYIFTLSVIYVCMCLSNFDPLYVVYKTRFTKVRFIT